MAKATTELPNALKNLDELPDGAMLPASAMARILSVHEGTIWRYAKAGRLTAHKIGPRVTRFNLGQVRALLAA